MLQTLIKWRLREVMAKYNIKSIDLAQEMRISPNSVSNLRKGSTMPRLDGDSLNKLCNALNKLALDLDEEITPVTLIDYRRDKEPDDDLKTSTLAASSTKKTPKKVVSPETVNHPSVLTVIPGVKSA
jgi:DNA-binding Xre family transcriptional regulator